MIFHWFQNLNDFADNIAGSLIKLFEKGYGNFHVIGFSLGGQISGAVGKFVNEKSQGDFKIPRITGLDPGQLPPFFQGALQDLNAGDAVFVDTIHGETKFFGSKNSLGNASFWINGGIYQPSCHSHLFLRELSVVWNFWNLSNTLLQSRQSAAT